MKKYYAALGASLAVLAAPAFAENTPFAGPSVGASLSLQSAVISNQDNPNFKNGSGIGQQSAGLVLHGSYGLPVSDQMVVLLGLDFNPVDIKSGEGTKTSKADFPYKLKNAWSLSVAPGFLINNQSLGYVKLSYEGATFKDTDESKTIDGYGLGFGIRTEINANMYLNAEIKRVTYNAFNFVIDADRLKPVTDIGTVGIGYRF